MIENHANGIYKSADGERNDSKYPKTNEYLYKEMAQYETK